MDPEILNSLNLREAKQQSIIHLNNQITFTPTKTKLIANTTAEIIAKAAVRTTDPGS